MGEKADTLQPFHQDRITSRILGEGDVLPNALERKRNALDPKLK
jgi:signal recognition particle GTPase